MARANWTDRKDKRLARMSTEERAEYDQAYAEGAARGRGRGAHPHRARGGRSVPTRARSANGNQSGGHRSSRGRGSRRHVDHAPPCRSGTRSRAEGRPAPDGVGALARWIGQADGQSDRRHPPRGEGQGESDLVHPLSIYSGEMDGQRPVQRIVEPTLTCGNVLASTGDHHL